LNLKGEDQPLGKVEQKEENRDLATCKKCRPFKYRTVVEYLLLQFLTEVNTINETMVCIVSSFTGN
jgi:hypothetical protein